LQAKMALAIKIQLCPSFSSAAEPVMSVSNRSGQLTNSAGAIKSYHCVC